MPDHSQSSLPPLEAVRRAEAEVKRRLAAAAEAGQQALAEAERRAREQIALTEAEGRRIGQAQHEAAVAEARSLAAAQLAEAAAEAARLQRAGADRLSEAVQLALDLVLEVPPCG